MKFRISSLAALALLAALSAHAASFGSTETFRLEFAIEPDGVVVVDNPFGNVEVVGVEGAQSVSWSAQKVVRGADQEAINEARSLTELTAAGDERNRIIQTKVPLLHSQRWSSVVNYFVRVPKGVHVKIASNASEKIRVADISGSVTIKNWNGPIILENVTGPVVADSLNGNVNFDMNTRPSANVQLSTVSGIIQLLVPPDSAFKWIATTFKGDFLTTFPVLGRFNGTKFLASVNGAQRGPSISTTSMMGTVFVLKKGTRQEQAQSVRNVAHTEGSAAPALQAQTFQRTVVDGDFVYTTSLGNISVGQVRGSARVETRAGDIQLGVVQGRCDITSFGGPITVGDVIGALTARTSAGDVSVNATRQGAVISTGGGMIKVNAASGSSNLLSEGGDIVVKQAFGAVAAETRSGDVTVAVDRSVRTTSLDLKTGQGNVQLTVPMSFGAEVEAIVVTSDPDANPIHSDLVGLVVRSREQVGGKTRIRATGRFNGGGERVVMYAEEGEIHVTAESMTRPSGMR